MGGAAATVVALVLGLAGTGYGLIEATRQRDQATFERDRAAEEATKAEQVSTFLTELFQASDPNVVPDTLSARELLRRGVERIDTDLADQPELRADLLSVMGSAHSGLGLYDEAETLYQLSLESARVANGDTSAEVADGLANLGTMARLLGRHEEAESLEREALGLRRALHGDSHPDVASSLNALGLVLEDLGRFEESIEMHRQALEQRVTHSGRETQHVAQSMNNLATLLTHSGDGDAAEPFYRESLEIRRAVHGDGHPAVATALNNLGLFLRDREDLDGPENHPSLAAVLRTLGHALILGGRAAQAEAPLSESVAIYESSLGEEDYRTIRARATLGSSFTARGLYAEAEQLLVASYDLLSSVHPDRPSQLERTSELLGELYEAWGKPDRAAEFGNR